MRFIPTFGRDFQLTMDAQRAGLRIGEDQRGLIQQVRKLGPLMVPVTIMRSSAAKISSTRWIYARSEWVAHLA